MSDTPSVIGFVGLGQMGNPMAANIIKGGFDTLCFDSVDAAERTPEGGRTATSLAQLVKETDTIFLSLPNGPIMLTVINQIIDVADPRTSLVVDLSTVGPAASVKAAEALKGAGIDFADAPVSGGRAGAIAATITLIYSGSKAAMESHKGVIDAFCGNPFHVGDTPGQGQALKLLNNFLSGTAMAATSEAVTFGLSHGLDMETILDVVNVSTGRNTASADKFPKRIMTGTYDAGFFAEHLNKDVQLYINEVRMAKTPAGIGTTVAEIWQGAADEFEPGTDFTRIYEYIGKKGNS